MLLPHRPASNRCLNRSGDVFSAFCNKCTLSYFAAAGAVCEKRGKQCLRLYLIE